MRKARANIQYHYDLGNDLYRLFLDDSMTYSCALWQEGDTLEQAQARKLRTICEKLRLSPGDHVLEIGCGWGSFALMAADEYGARVTGVTLSQQQLELARERVAAAGLADRIEIACRTTERSRDSSGSRLDRDAGGDRLRANPTSSPPATGCSPPAASPRSR